MVSVAALTAARRAGAVERKSKNLRAGRAALETDVNDGMISAQSALELGRSTAAELKT